MHHVNPNPLAHPGPLRWYGFAWNRFFELRGRSCRSEYWFFALFTVVLSILLPAAFAPSYNFFDFVTVSIASSLFQLASLIPSITVMVRRLHDTGRSGFWVLGCYAFPVLTIAAYLASGAGEFPKVGAHIMLALSVLINLITFIFTLQDSDYHPNNYGPNPKLFLYQNSETYYSEPEQPQPQHQPQPVQQPYYLLEE